MQKELTQALTAFFESPDFAAAIISSTIAGFQGSSHSVELFLDGSWRVIYSDAIGNRYEPEGEIIGIPRLSDEEYRDLCDIAGSSDPEALAEQINADILDETRQQMEEHGADDFYPVP